jgi:2-keto-4-pentenoate hydratase/2-oxohepta-3-ene-1,7-dioic acid hydratase in catechol pathway
VRTVVGEALAVALALAAAVAAPVAQSAPSDRPESPFKLATIEAGGKVRLAMVLGSRVVEIAGANEYLMQQTRLGPVAIPDEMRALIEQYETVKPRLYQIANYFTTTSMSSLPFAWDANQVKYHAPIKYPWNVLAAAANYRAHAAGMGATGGQPPAAAPPAGAPPAGAAPAGAPPAGGPPGGQRGGFNATVIDQIVPDRDAPIMFAKSPRSCIIDPGEPFYIVDGRERTDYEGEMAIIIGPKPAYRIPRERAHDYVFGYSIMNDVSDRGSERLREVTMFPGANWFEGKSTDRAAPFGPVIVPKEFLAKAPGNLKITTKVNGEILQDANTNQLIWGETQLVTYLASRLTLYPGDVISTGTPAGTGAERQKFLKPGDVVEIEVEGIGTLTTPFKLLSEKPATESGR